MQVLRQAHRSDGLGGTLPGDDEAQGRQIGVFMSMAALIRRRMFWSAAVRARTALSSATADTDSSSSSYQYGMLVSLLGSGDASAMARCYAQLPRLAK